MNQGDGEEAKFKDCDYLRFLRGNVMICKLCLPVIFHNYKLAMLCYSKKPSS